MPGGQGGDLGFDHVARVEQFDGADRGLGFGLFRGDARRLRRDGGLSFADENAGTAAEVHPAFDFQRDQRFPDARTADAELRGEQALRRQAHARPVLAGFDQPYDLVGDLAVESPGLNDLDGHGAWW